MNENDNGNENKSENKSTSEIKTITKIEMRCIRNRNKINHKKKVE